MIVPCRNWSISKLFVLPKSSEKSINENRTSHLPCGNQSTSISLDNWRFDDTDWSLGRLLRFFCATGQKLIMDHIDFGDNPYSIWDESNSSKVIRWDKWIFSTNFVLGRFYYFLKLRKNLELFWKISMFAFIKVYQFTTGTMKIIWKNLLAG